MVQMFPFVIADFQNSTGDGTFDSISVRFGYMFFPDAATATAELRAGDGDHLDPLLAELLLDDGLRGDAGVVEAGLPEGVEAAHAVPADERVLDRAVQRVPHVQRSGHVRRWHRDHVRLAGLVRVGVVEAFEVGGQLAAIVPRRYMTHAERATLVKTNAGVASFGFRTGFASMDYLLDQFRFASRH